MSIAYTVNGKSFNSGSELNMRILKDFSSREVFMDMTDEVEYILAGDPRGAPFSEEDFGLSDGRQCPFCGSYSVERTTVEEHFHSPASIELFLDECGNEYCYCPVCYKRYQSQEDAYMCCVEETVYACGNCNHLPAEDDMEGMDYNPICDVVAWYAVSPWMARQLEELGECVLAGKFWGRTSDLEPWEDPIVFAVCKSADILQGQTHAWRY